MSLRMFLTLAVCLIGVIGTITAIGHFARQANTQHQHEVQHQRHIRRLRMRRRHYLCQGGDSVPARFLSRFFISLHTSPHTFPWSRGSRRTLYRRRFFLSKNFGSRFCTLRARRSAGVRRAVLRG